MRISPYLLIVLLLAGCSTSEKSAYSCPDWSDNPIHNYSNKDFSNFGCAYYNNISAQVANPDDLVKGRGEQVSDGDRQSVLMQRYMSAAQPTVSSQAVSSTSSGR